MPIKSPKTESTSELDMNQRKRIIQMLATAAAEHSKTIDTLTTDIVVAASPSD